MLGFFTEPSGTVKDVTANVDDGIIYDAAKVDNSVRKPIQRCLGRWREKMTPAEVTLGDFVSLSPPLSFKGLSAPAYVCLLSVWSSSISAQEPLF